MRGIYRKCPTCKWPTRWSSVTGGGTSPFLFGFQCKKCTGPKGGPVRFSAKATPAEARALRRYFAARTRQSEGIHRLWHKFCRKFKTADQQAWKVDGWALMQRVDKLAGKPGWEGLHALTCDDSFHASSSIYLIEHRHGAYYWGTTVVVVSQCDGAPLKEFFLYECHLDNLVQALKKIQVKHKRSRDPLERLQR